MCVCVFFTVKKSPIELNINETIFDDDLLARHHRHMLEEQKDRKLYERYVRGQRTLRRLQCRRTHTAHLNQATRTRLLRELERERRYTTQDQICNYLSNHTIIFRHACQMNSKDSMTWSSLEQELPRQKHFDTIHQLDIMINNLKKVIKNSKDSISKPRLSVHERRKQRQATTTQPVHQLFPISSYEKIISPISRLPVVRFLDQSIQIPNSQHLTCIQNVLEQNHTSRKLSSTKQRPIEKENCNLATSVVLRAAPTMVSIKSSTFRSYPNTRKHPLTTRRHTRLSANV